MYGRLTMLTKYTLWLSLLRSHDYYAHCISCLQKVAIHLCKFSTSPKSGFCHVWRAFWTWMHIWINLIVKYKFGFIKQWRLSLPRKDHGIPGNSQWRHNQNDWLLSADTIWGMNSAAVLETAPNRLLSSLSFSTTFLRVAQKWIVRTMTFFYISPVELQIMSVCSTITGWCLNIALKDTSSSNSVCSE